MKAVYNKEVLTDEFRREIVPILELHRQELSKYEDMILNPDWELYYLLQDADRLEIYTARDSVSDELIGYAVYFIAKNPHYSDFLYAHQDIFYVTQDIRGSRVAFNLLKLSEKYLKEKNISVIVHHAKPHNRFGEMLSKLDFGLAEHMWHKRIN